MDNNSSKPSHLRINKLWKIAQRRANHIEQQRMNLTVEGNYRQILAKAKQLSGDNTLPIFERDYRHDNTDNASFMHAFMTNSFYFLLECDHLYNYRIQYVFHKCPFEPVIRGMMVGYSFDERADEVSLKPSFSEHYRNVLAYQDKKYITQRH